MAEIVDIRHGIFFKGTDHQFPITVLNKAQTAAIDISGWQLSFLVKKPKGAAAASITKTVAGGGISIGGVYNTDPSVNTQVATVTIEDTDTDSLATGVYYYELKRTDAGFEGVIVQGSLTVSTALHTS